MRGNHGTGGKNLKASVRAKVRHSFGVIKRQFGHANVHYHGLVKNTAQLITLFALSNIRMARRAPLQKAQGMNASANSLRAAIGSTNGQDTNKFGGI